MKKSSVQARGICKRYKSFFGSAKTVLKGVSLDIDSDEIFGILGPNGSGKTTLISIFSTLIYPEEGSLVILGLNARRDRGEIRKLINISTAKPNFPWSLTVKENLIHYGMLYGLYGSGLKQTVEDQIDAFELGEYRDIKFENLSTGLKQRLSLAKAMLNHPKLLFLDEPTTGLDPDMSTKTHDLIKRIHEEEKISVIMSTHYMPEAELLCDRIAFLRKGEIAALDTPKNLKNHLGMGDKVRITYRGQVDLEALKRLEGVFGVSDKSEQTERQAEIMINSSKESLDGILKRFQDAKIMNIDIEEPDLEDVFLELAR